MKQVAAAIAVRDGAILVTRRGPGEKLEGYWEFPGGKLEDGESVQECIVRELFEELSVRCVAGEIIAESKYEYPGGAITLIGVAVDLVDETIALSVHDAFDWVSPAGLLDLKLAPADVAIAEELARRYG
jgi:8-oxo-dGTP diphosphatase